MLLCGIHLVDDPSLTAAMAAGLFVITLSIICNVKRFLSSSTCNVKTVDVSTLYYFATLAGIITAKDFLYFDPT